MSSGLSPSADPSPPSPPGIRLALNISLIIERWEVRVREVVPAAREQERLALRNQLPKFLEEVARAASGTPAASEAPSRNSTDLQEASRDHGEQRAHLAGYSIDQVLQEYSVLRSTLFQVLEAEAPVPPDARNAIMDAIETAMREAARQFSAIQEDRLRGQHELHRLLVENARDYAMLTTDCGNRITSWNTGAERLMLWTEAEMLGQSATLIFTPEDRAIHAPEQEVANARSKGVAQNERWHLRKDGSRFWGSGIMHAMYDATGVLVGYGKVMRDRTADKEAEVERGRFHERLRMLADIASDFLFQVQPQKYIENVFARLAPHLDLDLYIHYAISPNGRGLAMASHRGVPAGVAQQIAYLDFGELISGKVAERRQHAVAEYLQQSQEPYSVLAHTAGVRAYACHPLIAGEELIGTLSFGSNRRDFFAPHELELIRTVCEQVAIALERSRLLTVLSQRAEALTEADLRKDEFLAMLAHELRNPLAAIVNALHVLDEIDREFSPRQRLRAIISRQVSNLTRMVDDLLDVSRITHGKIELRREPVDLSMVVQQAVETVRPLINSRGHQLEVSFPKETLCVEADLTRLEQVIANLLNNAAKYTPPGGQIRISATQEGSLAILSIRDNGVGISPELLPQIFELFTQANRTSERAEGGLGIGLTLVRRLIELHGGTIVAHSAGVSKGSEFVISLPLLHRTPLRHSLSERTGEELPQNRSRKILVVEDNVDAAETMQELLEIWGHDVRLAHSGPEGLAMAREFRPDFVLLDIGLPGMNGFEVARRLRHEYAGTPPCLVAITGYGQDADRDAAREAGFDFHLTKPVDPQRLQELLQTKVRRGRLH